MKIAFSLALAALFTLTTQVYADAPTITSISPSAGPVGSTVIIDGTGFVPPISITFAGNAAAAGSFTSTQVTVTVPSGAVSGPITVATSDGSAASSTFTVGSAPAAVATLDVTVPIASVSTGQAAEYTVTLSAAQANDVVVNYRVGGSAVNGTDYALLKGSIKVKAGKTSRVIKVVPEGNLGGASKKTVKLTLDTGTGYTVGTTATEKVKLTQ